MEKKSKDCKILYEKCKFKFILNRPRCSIRRKNEQKTKNNIDNIFGNYNMFNYDYKKE